MKQVKAPSGTQAAIRAISLLKAFDTNRTEMSLADLCTLTGLTKTTTYRLLTALCSEGLLERDAVTARYRLGTGILALASCMPARHNLVKKIHPVLEQIANDTGETTSLEVFTDGEVLILDEVNGRHLLTAAADIGTSWPVHATSTGKVFIAWNEQTIASMRKPLRSFTGNTITSIEQLQHESVAIRKQGYATTWCELEEEFAAVAAPIFTDAGELQGTISIGGPAGRLDRDRLQQLGITLKTIAADIH